MRSFPPPVLRLSFAKLLKPGSNPCIPLSKLSSQKSSFYSSFNRSIPCAIPHKVLVHEISAQSQLHINPIHLSAILSKKNWVLALRTEFESTLGFWNAKALACILKSQQNPIHSLKLCIWSFSFNQGLAKDKSVQKALSDSFCGRAR